MTQLTFKFIMPQNEINYLPNWRLINLKRKTSQSGLVGKRAANNFHIKGLKEMVHNGRKIPLVAPGTEQIRLELGTQLREVTLQ